MLETAIIGRYEEQQHLQYLLQVHQSDLMVVTGRRRVGKTYLIRTYLKAHLDFELTGLHDGTFETQLQNFDFALREREAKTARRPVPTNWLEAFQQLTEHLDRQKNQRKKVVFIDEFPWLDGHKSGFLAAFDWFWNTWAVQQNILVIICGSAASWMIRKVINNRGGLHNRVTQRMHLQPFTLHETEAYLKAGNVQLNRFQIAQLYMAFGGIPHYLKAIRTGESAMQVIERICFKKDGILVNEFDNLYRSMFRRPENHLTIVRSLAKKRKGYTRNEILANSMLTDGGTFSQTLEELEWSGFIESYQPFGKQKKDRLYRLTDEYSLFYLTFMHKKTNVNWQQLSNSATWKSWCGFSFETLCMKHLPNIKQALGIAGTYAEYSSFFHPGNTESEGIQIDLLIDRKDQVINLCEMKFSEHPYILSKKEAAHIRRRIAIFQHLSKTRKTIFPTFITTFGMEQNEHCLGLIQQHIELNDLFRS